jgi:N-methylhydantoinase B
MVAHGHAPREHEAAWPVEASVAFANAVLEAMPELRTPVQREARLALAAMRAPLDPETVRTAVHAVTERLESDKRCRKDQPFQGEV